DRISFNDVLGAAYRYSVTLNGTAYSVAHGEIVNGAAVDTGSWDSILAALEFKLEAGNAVTVEADSGTRRLTLTGAADNTAFSVDAVSVQASSSGAVADAIAWAGKGPDTPAGQAATQVSDLAFAGTAPAADT